MSDELAQQIPYPALGDLVQWLEARSAPYTVIGGLSVSIVSQPRPTIDIDVCPQLDLERIRYWVHEFALVLENPDLELELSKLIDK